MKYGFYKNKEYKNKRIVSHINGNAISIICFADHKLMGKSIPLFGSKYKLWENLTPYEKKFIPKNIDITNFSDSVFIKQGELLDDIKNI